MNRLKEYFTSHPEIALAFSGGVDSALIMYAAKLWSQEIAAYFVKSVFQPQFELDDAVYMAEKVSVPLRILKLDILSAGGIRPNPQDRCYRCKSAILSSILNAAAEDGFDYVCDGSNSSDDPNDRPGMRALAEFGIHSPLRELGICKNDVRALAKQAGLSCWDKPSYSCLATRIPTGREITAADLDRVEKGESLLFSMGLRDFRLRIEGVGARLELSPEDKLRFIDAQADITAALSGFEYIKISDR